MKSGTWERRHFYRKTRTFSDIKGNMHHKYNISLKDTFYIIDLAAGILFENVEKVSHPGDGKLKLMREKRMRR